MNRRTVLQVAAVGSAGALAGCLDGVREHFGLQGNVPIEITNEGEQSYNVQLDAQERGSGRQSYDQSVAVTPGERAVPPHVSQTEQQFRVRRIENDEVALVETVSITDTSQFIRIWIYDDRIEIEVRERNEEEIEDDSDPGNETDTADEPDSDGTATNDSTNS